MSDSPRGFLHSLASSADTFLTPVAQVLTRLVFGQAFLLTGWGKLHSLPKTTAFFESLGIPFANVQAPMISALEFVGGILLLAGLGTRIFAFLLSCTMVVALATADRADLIAGFTFDKSFADVAPLPFLVGLVWLIAKGPGMLSVDHLLAKRGKRS